MAAETAFLDALATHLAARPALAGARIGAAEPAVAGELPAVVLSLAEVHRLGAGLGERASLITGALPVTSTVDLANPVLPEEPTFRLLSTDRRTLVMPHGGWVKLDGSDLPLEAADLQVSVAGAARTVVKAAPGANEVRPDAPIGTLLFGAALPPAGHVVATYRIGQWERRLTPIAGMLHVDIRAAAAADVQAFAGAVIDALDKELGTLPAGLRKIALNRVSSIAVPDAAFANARGRGLDFAFEYEHPIDRPDSSGGVILRIPVAMQTDATTETFEVVP
ncbi:hypothetical protein [Variovorax rhizosphaerae]|uniref:Baseplate protein J-like domain-containing protein n=1 Tax=Variovorax rhizosphaerae TaxID=1836200 RepID=A0ABU8WRZ6_9BURK